MQYIGLSGHFNLPQGYRFLNVVVIRKQPIFDPDGSLLELKNICTDFVSGVFPVGHTSPEHIQINCYPWDYDCGKYQREAEAEHEAKQLAEELGVPFKKCQTFSNEEEEALGKKWIAYRKKEEKERNEKEAKEAADRMKHGYYYRSDFPNTPAGERAYQNTIREAQILKARRK